jgi:hypothetical protein
MLTLAGISMAWVKGGRALPLAQVDLLFDAQYSSVAADARALFPAIDSYPDNAGAVICDMLFELGLHGFVQFRDTCAAFKACDWLGAMAGIEHSELASQVPGRVENNISLLRVLTPSASPSTLAA